MRRTLLVFAIVVGLWGLGSSALAFEGLEGAVLEKYPNATNLNTCGTCHKNFNGNANGTNPYGAAFGAAFGDNGFNPVATMGAIEGGDADGDGTTNGEEMMADAGFLPGFSCDTADTAVDPPSNILDFVDPVDPGCDGVGPTTTLPPPTTTVPPPTTTTLPVVTTTTVINVTTTTITGPTTTTLPGEPKCSQPVTSGDLPRSSDCLYILRAAVEAVTCDPSCICSPTGDQAITSSDALLCLRAAVEQPVELNCECDGTTTTTVIGPTTTTIPPTTTTIPPTTTTTLPPGAGQVMNEACAVCHGADRAFDVAEMHPGLQTFADVEASIDEVIVDVDDLAETANLTVEFTVTDENGNYIPGLGIASTTQPTRFAYLRFALSRLQPAEPDSGDADTWVSYTTGDRTPANLTDNGDGTYTYVFATNLYANYVESERQRHRLLLIVYGDIVEQANNVTYDFVPAELPGPFTFDVSRDIVTTGACNECHGRLGSTLGAASFHGGSRYTAEACTVCHTTTLGGGLVELTPMVHKIHAAKVISDDPEEPLDFSEVTYPQDLRNCTKCHAGPDGSHWNTRPTRTACGSCHDSVDFDTGANHPGGAQATNQNCAASFCHSSASIIEDHLTENATPNNPDVPDGLVNFEYVIEEVTVDEANAAVVTFHINKDGVPLDLTTVPPTGFSGAPSFLVAYALPQDGVEEPADYNNRGRSAAQPASVSLACFQEPLPSSCTTSGGTLTGTPDSYTAVLTAAAYPAGATMRAVALQGYFTQLGAGPDGENVGRHTYSVVKPVTDDDVRREIVDIPKCLSCHEIFEAHGGNRVSNTQVCVMCHTPNLSSSGRAVDATKTAQAEKDKLAAAGYDPDDSLTWPEATNSFKDMIHGIHASGIRDFDYEFVRNRSNGLYYNWSEVTFPGIPSNCETCHKPDTYDAELPEGVLVTTDVTTDGINATRQDVQAARSTVPNATDLIISPTAAACSKCHDSLPAQAHMTQNGGVIDNFRAEALGD